MGNANSKHRSILVVGASSLIAEHCVRHWAEQGVGSFTLIARSGAKLQRMSDDLTARFPGVRLKSLVCDDFMDPAAIDAQLNEAFASCAPDVVLIAHGELLEQEACQNDLSLVRRAIDINAVSPVMWLEACVRRLEPMGRGAIAVIGSVAGDRGRQSNYVYGAAKGLVDRYVQGVQHRLTSSAVRVSIVKPGPTATPMTAHLQAQGQRMAPVSDVAKCIVDGVNAGKPVIYAPAIWWAIMMVIRHLPRFVFHRLKI